MFIHVTYQMGIILKRILRDTELPTRAALCLIFFFFLLKNSFKEPMLARLRARITGY